VLSMTPARFLLLVPSPKDNFRLVRKGFCLGSVPLGYDYLPNVLPSGLRNRFPFLIFVTFAMVLRLFETAQSPDLPNFSSFEKHLAFHIGFLDSLGFVILQDPNRTPLVDVPFPLFSSTLP